MVLNIIQQQNLEVAKRKYVKAQRAYYNDQPFMTDAEFDKLEDTIRKLDPTWVKLKQTGVRVEDKKTEKPLTFLMPSHSKQYPDDFPSWLTNQVPNETDFYVMVKYDGTSLQPVYKDGKPWRLFTRGDGELGKDISFMLPELVRMKKLPARISKAGIVGLRCEGIMKKSVFASKWSRAAAGKKGFDNARNMVNGLFNRQGAQKDAALADVDIIVVGMFDTELASGLREAKKAGFNVAHGVRWKTNGEHDYALEQLLANWRKSVDYEMDGLIIAPYTFHYFYDTADKPKQITAFKVNDEANAPQVKLLDEVWTRTRLNRWSCKASIPPTPMDGVIVTSVTLHNPEWMRERGIGKGAIIKVLRSGGVIPKVVGVVKKGVFQGPPGEYVMRGRFAYAVERNKAAEVRAIHFFFTTLGIELLAEKTIGKLYDSGFTSIHSYTKKLFQENGVRKLTKAFGEAGIGEAMRVKLATELERGLHARIPLYKLMVASGCFTGGGMGTRKLEQLQAAGVSLAELCTLPKKRAMALILEAKGFSDKTATILVDGIAEFQQWYKPLKGKLDLDLTYTMKKKKRVAGKLSGLKISWTTYRSAEEEALVEALGGEVVGFSTKTDVLLYNPDGKASTKIARAGSKAMTWAQFQKKYGV